MKTLQTDIYLFNPTCEYSIANGNENWNPNRILKKMESDLSILPMFFANPNDFILVEKIPSAEFISSFNQLKIKLPNFILKRKAVKDPKFLSLSKNKLFPWGWCPTVHKLFSPLKDSCSLDFQNSPVCNWENMHKEITSRKFAAGILNHLLSENFKDYFLPKKYIPRVCYTQEDFESAISDWKKVMIKAPWSSSGRGLQKITKQHIHSKVWDKILGIVNEQGYALTEPYLNKVLDLALQFEIRKGKVQYLGTNCFITDKKGQYLGNYLNGIPENIEKQVYDFAKNAIDEIWEPLKETLEASEIVNYYEGPFGVDMLIYSDINNELKINPCLEINVRYTMGLLALRLEKFVNQNKKGMFKLYFQPGKSFNTFAKEMLKKHPLVVKNNKIDSGFFALTEPNKDSLFGAYILA